MMQVNSSRIKKPLLLGFSPFFRKELQEWKYEKRGAIALLILLPAALLLLSVVAARFFAWQLGRPSPTPDLMMAATTATHPFWLISISLLLSISIIPKEVDQGTLAWNLTQPLSRVSFLLGKWLAYTLMIWLVGVVLVNFISLVITAIALGGTTPNVSVILLSQVAALCAIAFWVLLCILLGLLLKEQAAIIASAVVLIVIGFVLPNLPMLLSFLSVSFDASSQQRLQMMIQLYPMNTLDWIVNPVTPLKPIAYCLYMVGMAIATQLIFNRREYS